MSVRNNGHIELIDLIEQSLRDDIRPAEAERLDALLEADEQARSTYLDYADLHAWLRRRYAYAPPDCGIGEPIIEPVAVQRGIAPRRWLFGGLMLAVSTVVAVGFFFFPRPPLTAAPGVADADASLAGVAVVSRDLDAIWAEGGVSARVGEAVPAGRLRLESGVVQLDFYSGAVAVIEGPACLDLVSPLETRLNSGKLRTRVPSSARGFTVNTASGTLVDLGTEFAVCLDDEDNEGEVHVIDGEVRFRPSTQAGVSTHQLLEGDSLRFRPGGVSSDEFEYSADEFLGPRQVEARARRRDADRLAEWSEWRSQWLADPDLMAWYAYSPEPEWARTLRNFSEQAPDDSHGVVVGCEWAAGRRPNHRSLRFGSGSHRVSINLPGTKASMTLATWVMVDQLHPTNQVALMHPAMGQPRMLHWTLDRVPTGAVLHFSETAQPAGTKVSVGGEPFRQHFSSVQQGLVSRDVGSWIHLAVVYDANKRTVSHFRDGRMLSSAPIAALHDIEVGRADIGNWPYRDWARGTKFESRHLTGKVDEFVVVGRALTEAEIAEMYTVGKP